MRGSPAYVMENMNSKEMIGALISEVEKVVIGKKREITLLITAMLAGGHVLIEDVPGTGKTTLASALSKACGLSFNRAQFTPDVMASDITGFNVYNRQKEEFEFREGLVMTNILLADEINRASPKTQSALLEAMEEAMRMAQSPAGQKLIAMLRQADNTQLQQAVTYAKSGDVSQDSQLLSAMLSSPEAQKLLKELGGK